MVFIVVSELTSEEEEEEEEVVGSSRVLSSELVPGFEVLGGGGPMADVIVTR